VSKSISQNGKKVKKMKKIIRKNSGGAGSAGRQRAPTGFAKANPPVSAYSSFCWGGYGVLP